MQIYVVKPGDTLYSIGRTLSLAPGFLARYNGLQEPYRLAVGQSLLALYPEKAVTVRAGDTLSSIAASAVTQLEQNRTRSAFVAGYAYPYVQESVLRGILPFTGALMPFTYGFTPEGTLVPMDDERLLALAEDYGVRPVVLRSETLQRTLAEAALQKMQEKGYQGLDVDFEYLGQELAEAYAQFLTLLHERLAPYGLPLIAALAPKTSADQPGTLYEGYDYAAVASASDAVLLMTYEWGYTYGPPMAVAPVGAVRRVVEFALTQMEPGKILLGFPNYAYDWTLPFTAGATRAQSIGNEAAPLLAAQYGAEIQFDEQAQTPYFTYLDEAGQPHEVWFEDARSSLAKYRLVTEYGLCGIGYWNFMRPFTAGFALLNAVFRLEP